MNPDVGDGDLIPFHDLEIDLRRELDHGSGRYFTPVEFVENGQDVHAEIIEQTFYAWWVI